MANLPNNPFAELRNLEARVDQRLDMLSKAEANLKALLDSLRQQVGAAFPVVDQLNKLLPEARQQLEAGNVLPSIGELSAALSVGVDQARSDLEEQVTTMRRSMHDELNAAVSQARTSLLAGELGKPTRSELDAFVAAFRAEVQETLTGVRENLADQLDLLPSDAKMRIEPVLNEVEATRRHAEASVRSAAEGAQADMRRRAEQLRQSIDDIAVVLEQRLTQRTAALQQRAEAAMNALKPTMDDRLTALLAAFEQTLAAREREIVARIDAYPQRLDRQLADAEAMLMDRLARTERHATDMTAYLENKLTSRVDELVGRQRLKLHQALNDVAGTPTPEARQPMPIAPPVAPVIAPHIAGPVAPPVFAPELVEEREPPKLEASVFVRNARRPNLSPAA